jgi:hypothetical protein
MLGATGGTLNTSFVYAIQVEAATVYIYNATTGNTLIESIQMASGQYLPLAACPYQSGTITLSRTFQTTNASFLNSGHGFVAYFYINSALFYTYTGAQMSNVQGNQNYAGSATILATTASLELKV